MNNLPQIKRDLIASMDQRRAETRAFVETLPPELPVHKDSDWTVRDVIIHLTALEADMISALHSAIEGKAFSVDLRGQASVPELYELRRREREHLSWEQVLAEWAQTRNQLRGVVLAFPSELMEKPFSNPFFQDYNLFEAIQACGVHEARHLSEMRAAAEQDT